MIKNTLKYISLGLLIAVYSTGYAKDVPCPELTIPDLQKLHLDKRISIQGHKWYLRSTYKENHSVLGTFLPLAITPENIEHSSKITIYRQLTERECEYQIEMPELKANGYLLFSRVGD